VFAIYDDNGTKKLHMKGSGEFSGTITADEGHIGGVEKGWSIKEGGITSGDFSDSDSFHMYSTPTNNTKTINAEDITAEWALSIGKNFGVTRGG
jgi:hypothetical protein